MNHASAPAHRIANAAIVGAAYAVLTIVLAPISYAAVQCRVSEVLCILPFFIPYTAWGLFAGCLVANLFTGNVFDILFGSLATLLAALLTARLGRKDASVPRQLLACFMPVIFNAVIVGAVITWGYEGLNIFAHPDVFAVNGAWVGLGEAVVLYVLGFPLMRYLPRIKYFREHLERANR